MRLLVLNEARAGGGGVETYLAGLMPALSAAGHDVALLYANPSADTGPTVIDVQHSWSVADSGMTRAFDAALGWQPDVAFSHNMADLEVDAEAARRLPLVKMMHGYFGTCVSRQKAFAFPSVEPCGRTLGAACLAMYFPRRCGALRPSRVAAEYRWARRQQALFSSYRSIVVASEHMRREYESHGMPHGRVHAIPLFTQSPPDAVDQDRGAQSEPIDVLFIGRMTHLKGPAMLVEACRLAARRLGRQITLTLAGDGPLRAELSAGADGVVVTAPGWVDPAARAALLSRARVAAVPSRWPEPFGLAGIEALAAGVPVVAFDVGGIATWLEHDRNGYAVDPRTGVEGLAAALTRLLSNPAERDRLASGARETSRRFSMDTHVAALTRVLERARE